MNRSIPKHSNAETMHIAWLKKGSETFEIFANADKALSFKEGKGTDIKEAIVSPKIFTDAKKGMLASEMRLQAVFNTTDTWEIAKIIIREGKVPETQHHREELEQQTKKRILDILSQQSIDPRTNAPHPLTRLENAMEEAKIKINPHQTAEAQLPAILKELKNIMPIKLAITQIEVTVEASNAGKAIPILKQTGKLLNETWLQNGSLIAIIEIFGGLQEVFEQKLMSATKGTAQFKIIKIEER